jgi:hypothetical protein
MTRGRRHMRMAIFAVMAALSMAGCVSLNQGDNSVRTDGPNHLYQDYVVNITSNPPGARIEWNGETIGNAPLQRVLNGTRGLAAPAVIKAYPVNPGARVMVRRIAGDEPIPDTIDFNWNTQ